MLQSNAVFIVSPFLKHAVSEARWSCFHSQPWNSVGMRWHEMEQRGSSFSQKAAQAQCPTVTVIRLVCVCSGRAGESGGRAGGCRKQICTFGSCWDPNSKARASDNTCVGPGAECSARQVSWVACRLTAEQDAKGRLYQ